MDKYTHSGRCLCGNTVFSVTAEPIHTTICHCKMCQRSTGSSHLLEPIFFKKDFAVTRGTPKTFDYRSDMSAKLLHINFCANCGTKLFQTFERFPEVVGVFGGTFDNPNWFSRTPENTRHIFVDSALKGDLLPADFTLYHQHTSDPKTGEGLSPFKLNSPKQI